MRTMKASTRRSLIGGTVIALLTVACPFAPDALASKPSRPKPPAVSAPSVGHAGRWFTDNNGRVLIFHGAEAAGSSPGSEASLDPESDSAAFEGAGFNILHLMTNWATM